MRFMRLTAFICFVFNLSNNLPAGSIHLAQSPSHLNQNTKELKTIEKSDEAFIRLHAFLNSEDITINAINIPTGTFNFFEGFENVFPGADWTSYDDDGYANGEYYWDKTNHEKFEGQYSVWCAAGGADGHDPSTGNYPNNCASVMTWGPFDLSNASSCEFALEFWLDSQREKDALFWGALKSDSFSVVGYSGYSAGWYHDELDISDLSGLNWLGNEEIYFLAIFISDESVTDRGAYIDNVRIDISENVDVTFACDMVFERLSGRFDPSTDVLNVRGSFNGWSGDMMIPSAQNSNLYIKTIPINVNAGDQIDYKYAYDMATSTVWENDPNKTYTFTQADIDAGEVYIRRAFNNVDSSNVTLQESVVKFTVDMNDAKDVNDQPFPSIDNVVLVGGTAPLQWPSETWPDGDESRVIHLNDSGSDGDVTAGDGIWSRDIVFPLFTFLDVIYKYGANWGLPSNNGDNDNEAGFGDNHTVELVSVFAGATIKDIFGVMGESVLIDIVPVQDIYITSPNGGEALVCEADILWTSQNTNDYVKIEYECDGVWTDIISSAPDVGRYEWMIPEGTQCTQTRIRVSDASNPDKFDVSDDYFSIDCPGGGPCVPPYVKIDSIMAVAGMDIEVPVRISGNVKAIDAFGLRVVYCADKLTFLGVRKGDLTESFSFFDGSESSPGNLTIGGFHTTQIPVNSDGAIAIIDLHVDECITGETCALFISNLTDDLSDMNICNGTFECGMPCLLGDVNDDGAITPGDALCAFQIYLGGGTPPPSCDNPCALAAADVNCTPNGITPGDALYIFQAYLAGKTPPLDCDPSAMNKEGNQMQLKLDDASAIPGEQIEIPVHINAASSLNAFGLEFGYPSDLLTFNGIKSTAITSGWEALEAKENETGLLTIGAYNAKSATVTKSDVLVNVLFTVKEDAAGGGEIWLSNTTDDVAEAELINGRFSATTDDVRRLGSVPSSYAL
ncbi:MAG: cohesin domain-containing protein, partial [candidate division KSB1 bacterium]|nr:cohesin domain-containing protein [candidate division KSB1 bacterium]